jgi:hypothetical protein
MSTPIDLLRRERRLRKVQRLTRIAGEWPISVLVSWFVVEAAQRLAPEDPVPSFAEAARDLVRRAIDVDEAVSTTMLASSMEGLVARHLRRGDRDALLKDAADLALAFESVCRHARLAGSLGRMRAAVTVPLAHHRASKRGNRGNPAWHP